MRLSETKTKIILQALETYRDKLISMRLDPILTKELINDIRKESKLNKPIVEVKQDRQIHPLNGEPV